MLVENLQEKSLVSQQIVHGHINSNKIKVQEYDISIDFLKSCRLANGRYITTLEKAIKQKDDSIISKKWKMVDEETNLHKRKTEEEIKCTNTLDKDAKKMYTKAEEIQDFNLLAKTNSFRKESRKNRKLWKTLTILSRKWNNEKKILLNFYIWQDSFFFTLL